MQSKLPIQKCHSGVVEAISWSELAVLGAASVHCCTDLRSKHLAKLHTPLVKAVDAPDKALYRKAAKAGLAA